MIVDTDVSSKVIYDLDTFHGDYQISYENTLTIIKGKTVPLIKPIKEIIKENFGLSILGNKPFSTQTLAPIGIKITTKAYIIKAMPTIENCFFT